MANPRKFSEKIALHNQKQAEETAAFEAIIRDVTAATRGSPGYPAQNQHLQLQQNIGGPYRAGSLPNVNQMVGNPGIDLQTTLQHLEDIRAGGPVPGRLDRIHNRERVRQLGPHRRGFPDKPRTDCSPYGSAFLSPPPDTSWRRTNSDSALHTSAMGPAVGGDLDHMASPTTPPSHRRLMEVVGENSLHGGDGLMKGYWDPKKQLPQSRPKSCEVPNINIYPSSEQENQASGIHVPITTNTGSLPDLTVLHFPPPLTTPLDAEDQNYNSGGQAPQGTTPSNLSPTSAHHIGGMGPPSPQAQSPVQRRRPPHGGPSPLVLSGSPTQQMRLPHSPPVSVPNIDPSKLSMDPRLKQQYLLYMRQQQHRQRAGHPPSHPPQSHPSQSSNNSVIRQPGPHPHQVPQVRITSPCDQNNSQPSLTQYRNNVSESNCQSPTSPLSQTSYSPAQSPGLPPTSWNNSPFAENYQRQQQQQQQTNALQHQFEQFNMSQDNHFISSSADSPLMTNGATNSSAIYTSPQNTINLTQAMIQGMTGSNQDLHQQYFTHQVDASQSRVVNPAAHLAQTSPQQQQSTHGTQQQTQQHQQPLVSPNSKIPDIIFTGMGNNIPDFLFTGADDTSINKDFAKELGNAITGMPDGFDTDFFTSDEALKVGLDPLDLDGLQMLTDPNMITDPATEESFKLDRL